MKSLEWYIQRTLELQMNDEYLRAFLQSRSSPGFPDRRGTASYEYQKRRRNIAACFVLSVLLLSSVLPFGGCATNYTETYRFSSYDPYERRSSHTSDDQDGRTCSNTGAADASTLPVETTLDRSAAISTPIALEDPEPPGVILKPKVWLPYPASDNASMYSGSRVVVDSETQFYRDASGFPIPDRYDEDVGDFWCQAGHHPLISLLIGGADKLALTVVALTSFSLPSKIALALAIWFVDILLSAPACEDTPMAENHAPSGGNHLMHRSGLLLEQPDKLSNSYPAAQYSTGAQERHLPLAGQARVAYSPDRGNDHRANYDSRAGYCTVN